MLNDTKPSSFSDLSYSIFHLYVPFFISFQHESVSGCPSACPAELSDVSEASKSEDLYLLNYCSVLT